MSEQVLALNIPDFERAGLQRKSGYKFFIRLKGGKPEDVIIDSPLASGFVTALLENSAIREVLSNNDFEISLSPKFELSIKHLAQLETITEEPEVV